MSFTSINFIFYFLPITFILYYFVNYFKNDRLSNVYLLIVSILFYLWNDLRIGIFFIISCFLVFLIGKLITKSKSKCLLTISILLLVGVLVYYKYLDFALGIINRVLHKEIDLIYLTIPLGLSFACFEAISYLVDVYRGENGGSLVDVLLFLMFFPKISSGPIVTWNKFNKQLVNRQLNINNTVNGVERIIYGVAKKVIVADVLCNFCGEVISNYQQMDSLTVAIGAFCFMLEIYLDFSAYSDIAIGISLLFGFKFDENFNYPYCSKSMGEFWRRWHISLGNFFKNYLYIPLGGNRKHVYLNLFIVFFVSGLWHGNGLAYIVWGIFIGLIICLERYIRDKEFYKNTPNFVKWLLLMIMIYFSWILFMMPSLSQSIALIKRMFAGVGLGDVVLNVRYYLNNRLIFTIVIGVIVSFVDVRKIIEKNELLKYIVLILLFVISFVYIVNSLYSTFLYFRF